jgi:cyanophycin synthetase
MNTMEFLKVLALRGPNIWANFPVIEAWVDLGKWKDTASDSVPGFNERIMTWLPTMIEHRCSIGERGGFFERLRTGTYPAHILEHVTLELQALAGVPSGFGRARETSEEGVYKVVFKYKDETLARACLDAGRELVLAALQDKPFDVAATVDRLRDVAEQNVLGPSTDSIVQAGRKRNIPFRRLNDYSLVQLGYGSKQRRIRASETDETRAIAESIAQDKELTRKLLQSAGVPTAEGYPVTSPEDAWETAQYIGVPVVVKPRDGNQGRGVTTNVTTQEQVVAAYAAALEESSSVVVEKFAPGNDYRLLVVDGKVVAASRREPAQVMGDGHSTVRELVEVENRDPRRAEHHASSLSKIHIDEIGTNVLKDQGFTPDSVPPAGQMVLIRRNANLSTGGTAIDVTELVHPEVAARAIDAAKVVGLDIAGIDVIATDITKPLEDQHGIIVEVNAAPGLRMHLAPSTGERREVGEAIIDMLFPPGENGRIPIAAVTGTNGKTTVTRFLAHILRDTGKTVGMTTTDGIWVDDRRILTGDCSGPISAGYVLMNPNVDIAVLETARGGILRAGLAFNECQVAVVTNIGEGDHLGTADTSTVEMLAKVKRTIVDVVADDGTAVLNANDPLVAGMAPFSHGRVLFFARDGQHPEIVKHRAGGGAAIFVRDGVIVLAEGEREQELIPLTHIPMTFGGRVTFEVENALAALGAAWAMGVPKERIVERARCFSSDMNKVPSRFNILELRGATVIVDYGHNTHALRAMIEALAMFPHERRAALYSSSGDRRDHDIVKMGELLGNAFDRVITYEDPSDMYERKPGEIMALLRQGLDSASRVKKIEEIQGGLNAFKHALATVQPGELLLAQAHLANPTMEYLHEYLGEHGQDGKTQR